MRLKQRVDDFRVRELLAEDVVQERGAWRVYRVTKRKRTSLEAARMLAEQLGVEPSDVSMAGLKDRQGVTVQHMAVRGGRPLRLKHADLVVETVGSAHSELSSADSSGNAFQIVARGLEEPDLRVLRRNLPIVRASGVVNYFDEQRFGNLRHGQGWIALELMRGRHERALQALLAAPSDHDDGRSRSFKRALNQAWGDWSACREVAGRHGQHHSVFEHLKREPEDFAGAFEFVASRLRLIHLYAYQSHVWNRAVAAWVRGRLPLEQRVLVPSDEGPLLFPAEALPDVPDVGATFRLPGPGLEDVSDATQRQLLEDALAEDGLVAAQFDIRGVPGFQLKGEDRALFVHPRHLRVRPPEPDALNRGSFALRVRFELPRGAYATLVVKRLLAETQGVVTRRLERARDRVGERPQRTRRERSERRDRRERRELPGTRGGRGRRDSGRVRENGSAQRREERAGGNAWEEARARRAGRGRRGPQGRPERGRDE